MDGLLRYQLWLRVGLNAKKDEPIAAINIWEFVSMLNQLNLKLQ